jgi:hypothetical protein
MIIMNGCRCNVTVTHPVSHVLTAEHWKTGWLFQFHRRHQYRSMDWLRWSQGCSWPKTVRITRGPELAKDYCISCLRSLYNQTALFLHQTVHPSPRLRWYLPCREAELICCRVCGIYAPLSADVAGGSALTKYSGIYSGVWQARLISHGQ